MLTPFTKSGDLDLDGLKKNVDFLIENGVSQIMCLGSTGEAATLTREECIKIIEATSPILEYINCASAIGGFISMLNDDWEFRPVINNSHT